MFPPERSLASGATNFTLTNSDMGNCYNPRRFQRPRLATGNQGETGSSTTEWALSSTRSTGAIFPVGLATYCSRTRTSGLASMTKTPGGEAVQQQLLLAVRLMRPCTGADECDTHQRRLPRLHQGFRVLARRVSLPGRRDNPRNPELKVLPLRGGRDPAGVLETPTSVTIQNNWFGQVNDYDTDFARCGAIRFSANAPISNTLIRYNSFAAGQGIVASSGSPTSSVQDRWQHHRNGSDRR